MVQTVGIHLGERSFHLVALDGSLKKHKVVCRESGEIAPGEDVAVVVERLRELAKGHRLAADSVFVALDSGVASFRSLTLPFDDREKIEEVLKFEIEGNLPQFDIDQVVVDFLTLSSKPGVESNMLVTAVPKDRLRAALQVCERAGLEALEAELEGTALFDAAFERGILVEDEGTVLIHVGDVSTTVVVADGTRLASMRAIRVGASLTRPAEVPAVEEDAEGGEPASGAADESGARQAVAQRVRRELARTLSGSRTAHEVRHVYLCGQELPGLVGESLADVSIEPLPFELGEGGDARRFVVAFGAALRGFEGGRLKPRLRREELRFSGRFERLELPLAVFSLLLFTFLFVQYIVLDKQLEWRDEGNLAMDIRGDMQIWLEASNQAMLPDPTNARPVRLPDAPENLKKYAADAQAGRDEQRTKFEELQHIRRLLQDNISRLSRELGQDSDIKQPQSALTAATLVMGEISSMGQSARVGIRRFEATYQHSAANREDYVTVTIDADFFGESSLEATRSYNELENRFKSRPWCNSFEGKSTKSLDADKGIQVDGLVIEVNVDKSMQGGQA
jgi:Tfp pilus assembly PilM family ATPase